MKLKNPRSGRGNGALVILGSLDRDTRQLGGLSVSGLPVAKSKFERNVYIMTVCSTLDRLLIFILLVYFCM